MTKPTPTDTAAQIRKPTNAAVAIHKALRCPKVLERTGLSKTHLYRLVQRGDFPAPHKLSERVSAWSEEDVDSWLAARFGS
jgi:prophage regulatory protein